MAVTKTIGWNFGCKVSKVDSTGIGVKMKVVTSLSNPGAAGWCTRSVLFSGQSGATFWTWTGYSCRYALKSSGLPVKNNSFWICRLTRSSKSWKAKRMSILYKSCHEKNNPCIACSFCPDDHRYHFDKA